MDLLSLVFVLAYGGPFADNVGVRGHVRHDWYGASVGVAYTKYLTITAAPEIDFDVGGATLFLSPGYALDYDSAGDSDLLAHNGCFSVGLEAPVSDDWVIHAEVNLFRFPLDVRSGSREVPIEATDASFFHPGVGVGWAPLR